MQQVQNRLIGPEANCGVDRPGGRGGMDQRWQNEDEEISIYYCSITANDSNCQ